MKSTRKRLLRIFESLLKHFGHRHWWPGETPLEVAVGAILTQNTAWRNVEKAIANLKREDLLDAPRLHALEGADLAELLRPAGFFNLKSRRLKNFIRVLCEDHGGHMADLGILERGELRGKLLGINGIGPETADSIVLYALDRPVFVIDGYTRRFLVNHGLSNKVLSYDEAQRYFMDNLPEDTTLFNEFHALIVRLCQDKCRRTPACDGCPLEQDRTSCG
jgi:endonuclease III related protein